MPLDVIMPALGMAQDTGKIVAWQKQAGDAVVKGDVLFEVETDKATMEVEAQGDGFLTDVSAGDGDDVPVGDVIAKISETATNSAASDTSSAQAAPASAPAEDLPAGKDVIMPTLGMAQDTGLLVTWHKAAGDEVAADDVLFEVETDKSTVEVNAGFDGFVAAILASEGEEIPVGQTIAIISADAPANPVTRAASAAPAQPAAVPETPKAAPAATKEEPAKPPPTAPLPATGGRILASPKLRRLARDQGHDLGRLVAAGYAQPFHVKDLETLKSLPDTTATGGSGVTQTASRLTAEIPSQGFTDFAAWAAKSADLPDTPALMAGLVAASAGQPQIVAIDSFGTCRTYAATANLGTTVATEDTPQIRVRDLRFSAITTVQVGAEDMPTLTLTRNGDGLAITLEYAHGQLSAADAITLLSNFAGRMEQPLRHLL